VWVSGDADKRGRLGCLIAVLIFLSWPWGLIAWLILRPQEQPLSLKVNKPTTLSVANESEARVMQQRLISFGIACQIVTLASGFAEIQIAQADKEAAEALLEVTPAAVSDLPPTLDTTLTLNKPMTFPKTEESEAKGEKTDTKNLLFIVLIIVIVTLLTLLAGLGRLGI